MNLYGYAAGDPVNNSDPTGLSPCTAEQRERGWQDVKGADGASECMSNNSAHPITITAQSPGFFESLASGWKNGAAIAEGWQEPVQLGVPSWIGGPGGAAKLTTKQAYQLAKWLGFGKRVRGAPFNSMGQQVYTNGKVYISQDVTMHVGTEATWKMFSMGRDPRRIGTYNYDLTEWLAP